MNEIDINNNVEKESKLKLTCAYLNTRLIYYLGGIYLFYKIPQSFI